MTELWSALKIGDKVRFIRLPEGWMHDETRVVYEALIATGAVLAVDQVDEFGHPWTEPFDVNVAGQVTCDSGIGHTLAIIDDTWEWV
ncbi:hypothetical protein [Armatimonas sp.]|uniref:hypothetical protein n=1 Tax=Armatimonas sp. TaxID=1872638 RepID=UPI00374FFEB5